MPLHVTLVSLVPYWVSFRYLNDTALVRAAGYLSPADATLDAYSALVNDANRAGTCAQVTIVIKQTMLLTRTAVRNSHPLGPPRTPSTLPQLSMPHPAPCPSATTPIPAVGR